MISNHTQKFLHNVYFRAEWNFADTIARRSDQSAAFIVPVMLDALPQDALFVPTSFRRKQFEHIPQGVPSPEFAEQLRHLSDTAKERRRRPTELVTP